jgi:chromosome segregation ATPase
LRNSPSEPTIDLEHIGQALARLTSEIASLRDDLHVLTAVVQRLDNSHGRMLEDIRGMHRQHSRLTDRVRRLETQP